MLAVRIEPAQRALWLLVAGGVACLLGPELLYVRDEFDGCDLFRMNTVFKLGYQAWLLLGLAGVAALAWRRDWLPRRARPARRRRWRSPRCSLGAAVYPVAGTYASREGFARSPTLDGLGWLRDRAPGDVAAIAWLDDHAPAGVRRARGGGGGLLRLRPRAHLDVHRAARGARLAGPRAPVEHDPGTRARDVERMYRGDAAEAVPLLQRYGVRYVVVGPLERTDHGDAGIAKWDALGRRVLDRDGTVVWDLAGGPVTPSAGGRATRASRPSGSTARAA